MPNMPQVLGANVGCVTAILSGVLVYYALGGGGLGIAMGIVAAVVGCFLGILIGLGLGKLLVR